MTYRRKTVTIKREEFNQLILYIQQVTETVDILKERYNKNFKMENWFAALEVHTEFMTKYLGKLVRENGYKENIDLLKEWACK